MKRLLCSFLALSLLIISGCSTNSERPNLKMLTDDVELTIPASFMGENPSEELDNEDKADGFKSAKLNADGSMTYTIGKSDYDRFIKETAGEVSTGLLDYATSEDFPSIKKVEFNVDFTNITFTVNRASYENGTDEYATLGAEFLSIAYHMFLGTDQDKLIITINIKDEATNEVFAIHHYP